MTAKDKISLTSSSITSVVNYHCNQGYRLIGTKQRTCLQDGTWDQDVPTCEPVVFCNGTEYLRECPVNDVCEAPSNPINGKVIYNGLSSGSNSTYTCLPGFRLVGPTVRTCGHGGTWAGSPPSCRARKCPPVQSTPTPPHSRVDYTGFTVGHNVSYTCEKGYLAKGVGTRTCRVDGTWEDAGPFECIPISGYR